MAALSEIGFDISLNILTPTTKEISEIGGNVATARQALQGPPHFPIAGNGDRRVLRYTQSDGETTAAPLIGKSAEYFPIITEPPARIQISKYMNHACKLT